ncbi:hypothetical protein PR048_017478 [Dryococelus australis]|uniref:Uncharacterized protein n=1 Tax=Dryococelus australis TaxID=614101 RepID=A0ABQ9H9U4_9NEOP|nr:hypothetical protein PR048_017478 [Dryococelus australis]
MVIIPNGYFSAPFSPPPSGSSSGEHPTSVCLRPRPHSCLSPCYGWSNSILSASCMCWTPPSKLDVLPAPQIGGAPTDCATGGRRNVDCRHASFLMATFSVSTVDEPLQELTARVCAHDPFSRSARVNWPDAPSRRKSVVSPLFSRASIAPIKHDTFPPLQGCRGCGASPREPPYPVHGLPLTYDLACRNVLQDNSPPLLSWEHHSRRPFLRRASRSGETEDLLENSPTSGTVRHDSHTRKSGGDVRAVTRSGTGLCVCCERFAIDWCAGRQASFQVLIGGRGSHMSPASEAILLACPSGVRALYLLHGELSVSLLEMGPKKKCSFNEKFQSEYKFLKSCENISARVRCLRCSSEFSVQYRGRLDTEDHGKSDKHKKALSAASSANITSFFENKVAGGNVLQKRQHLPTTLQNMN